MTRSDAVLAARILARLGHVHAFGHVSVRAEHGFWMSPIRPYLGSLAPDDLLQVGGDGEVRAEGADRVPLETPMHAAIYRRRTDVGATCRVHGPAVSAWASRSDVPPLLHGFGGLVEPVALWPDPDLIASVERGEAVAAAMGDAPCILLRGNGALTVGATMGQAVARAWALEDRCRVALAAGDDGAQIEAEPFERRRRWYSAETERLWGWLREAYGVPT